MAKRLTLVLGIAPLGADFDSRANTTGSGKRKITASIKATSNDEWQAFRMSFPDLPARIISVLESMEGAAPPP